MAFARSGGRPEPPVSAPRTYLWLRVTNHPRPSTGLKPRRMLSPRGQQDSRRPRSFIYSRFRNEVFPHRIRKDFCMVAPTPPRKRSTAKLNACIVSPILNLTSHMLPVHMLVSLTLKNFRGFDSHTVHFTKKVLLVGKNNAGKSTCVEALRLVSLVTERLGSLAWRSPRSGYDIPTSQKGVSPSLDDIVIHKECLFHRYSEPPALVTACFSNGTGIEVHVGSDLVIHAIIRDAHGRVIKSRPAALAAGIPRVSILPQIGPLSEEEKRLSDDHVRRNYLTSLASLHFRNQLRLSPPDLYEDFCTRVTRTWPRLRIESLEVPNLMDKGEG